MKDEERKRLIEELIEEMNKGGAIQLLKAYQSIEKEKQRETIVEIINEIIKVQPNRARILWGGTAADIRLSKFKEVCNNLKKGDIEKYKHFVSSYIQYIEFDSQNNPIIAEELEKIIFNPTSLEQAEKIEKEMPIFIKNWDNINKNIQYIKANNELYGNLETRTNYELVQRAYSALTRIKPQNASGIEFENTAGSELVGKDITYTNSPETAVQRAHILAEKMDKAGLEKKYPDFSVKDEKSGIVLKVLHPQDKSAILLGFDATCCFRPNANADNSARNEYSLLQYCTTTPYGGIIKCGELNEKGTAFSKVYMGTPFMVNGNCMMLHSYETKNGLRNEIVNDQIVEAAKKAIELSNGDIKVVMMTDLHKGQGRLRVEDKYAMNSYFEAYFGEEYKKYEDMYTNLEQENVLIAAKVGEKILAGEELKQWCISTCEGKDNIIQEKLGLHFGKIEKDYKFEERKVSFERKIDNVDLVNAFKKQYDNKKAERVELALYKTKLELERKDKLNENEQKQLECINEDIANLEPEKQEKYAKLGMRKLEVKLKENSKELMDIYAGNNLQLIAQQSGISKEQFEEIIKQKAQERAKEETINVKVDNKRESMEKQKTVKYSKDEVFRKQVLLEEMFPKDREDSKSQKKLFDRLKASITIGIEKREEMDRIMKNINENSKDTEKYDHLIFGANWYIATGEQGQIDMHIKEEANKSDRSAMKDIVQKMVGSAKSEKEAEYIQAKYNKVNKNEISMEQLKECIKTVTAEERAQALATMKRARIIHREERGIANENDR